MRISYANAFDAGGQGKTRLYLKTLWVVCTYPP